MIKKSICIVQINEVLIMTLLKMFEFFGTDNNSKSHADNHKSNFLVLGEGPIFGINGSLEFRISREKN